MVHRSTNTALDVFRGTAMNDVLNGISAVSGKALSMVGDMVTSSLNFEDAMAKVATIADTTVVPIGNMQEAIVDLSNETGIAAIDIADNVLNDPPKMVHRSTEGSWDIKQI